MSNQGMYRPAETQKVDIWRKGEAVVHSMKSSGQSTGFDKSGMVQQEGQSASAGMGVSPATEGGAKFHQQVLSESGGSNLGQQMRTSTESFAPHTTSAGYDPNLGYAPMSSGGNQASLASTRELQGGVKEDESLWQKAKHALGADTHHTRDTSTSNYGTTGTYDRSTGQQDESLWQKTKHALGVDNDKPSSSGTSGSSNLGTTTGTTYGHDAAGMPTKTTTTTTVTEGPPGMTQGMTQGAGMTQGHRDDILCITPSSMQRGGMGQSGREDTAALMHGTSSMQGGSHVGDGGMHHGSGEMHQGVSSMEQQYHGGQAASYQGNMSEQGGQYQGGSYQGHHGQPMHSQPTSGMSSMISQQHHTGNIGGQGPRLEPQSHFESHGTHQGSHQGSHPGYVSTQGMSRAAPEPSIMGHHGPMMQGHRSDTRQQVQQQMHPAEWQKDRSALEMGHGSVAGSTGIMGSIPSSGGHEMMQQKSMIGGHQTLPHHQLTPQEIDDEVVGRMRQRGYAPLDLIQCSTHYLALFDLPGVFKDQISLCIDRGLLKMTVHRPENNANPHQKHREQQQESGLNQQPNPQFQGQQQSGFGKVTVEDDVDDDFDIGVVKAIEHAYERDRQAHQRSQVQSSQIRDSGSMSSGGVGAGSGQSTEMRKSPNVLPQGGQYLCKERPTGRIDRFIRLPHDIQETVSDAKLENGVLSVTIGRTPHHQRAGGMMGGASR